MTTTTDRRIDPPDPCQTMHPAEMAVCDRIQPTPQDAVLVRMWDRAHASDTKAEILAAIEDVYSLEAMC